MLFIENATAICVFIFVLAYTLIILKYEYKTYFVMSAVFLYLILGVLTPSQAFMAINWNVIGIYIGMLFISEIFILSKIPDLLADMIVNKSSKVWIAMLGVSALAGVLSIAIENVAVVLIIAPIALHICRKLKINAAPLLISIALMSNLQGVATMIGDPPSLLMASYAKMSFNDFFIFAGKPSLFFAVQAGAIAGLAVLYLFFKSFNNHPARMSNPKIKSLVPAYFLIIMIIFLAFSSIIEFSPNSTILQIIEQNKLGLICLLAGLLAWWWYYFKDKKNFIPMARNLDWGTGLFLIGIFILVEGLVKVGFMKAMAEYISLHIGTNLLTAYLVIVVISVVLSAFIDNVPFIAAMLPVIHHLSSIIGSDPYVLYFGLLIGASVGGNITPVGASANIVAMGILHKNKYKASFLDFVKMGLPFTVISVLASTTLVWLVFS